ncbi:MAG: DNA methyltransferase [Bacteroidales bacterium]|nr:DNA methyltransferase [Bacteroidales bacterium]
MGTKNLAKAKKQKNDEFYTQYIDIEKEINSYLDYNPDVFKGKTILLPCDDPEWSNFTKYFAQNFERFGIKKLISTSFAQESKNIQSSYQPTLFETEAPQFDKDKTKTKGKIFTLTHDTTGDGKIDVNDLEWDYLEGTGDFRSNEVKTLRDESDIIITNPPFSLFREFFKWIIDADKQFLVIGNMNTVKYKEVFPYIQENKVWLGNNYKVNGGAMFYEIPEDVANLDQVKEIKTSDSGEKKYITRVPNVRWFTNLPHGRLHQPIQLMSMDDNLRYNKKIADKNPYRKYDNYDAIEVPYVDAIPKEYDGVMGVPISILDKHCAEQFEIVGLSMKYGFGLESNKQYDSYKEIKQDGSYTGSSGRKTNGNPMFEGKHEKNNYYIDSDGNCAYSLFDRIFIKHKRDLNENNA